MDMDTRSAPSFGACLATGASAKQHWRGKSGSLKGISSSGASKFAFCSLFGRDSGRIPVIRATKDGGRAAVLLWPSRQLDRNDLNASWTTAATFFPLCPN
ncbi:hypothetical protein, partial [Sinorhizobium meliloti]|uniref:hypothetical protein n=1 Tax=Rhizobium meliloti TaxID=382 RepID=UPI001AECA9B8